MNRLENHSKPGMALRALLLVAFVGGCGDSTAPTPDLSPTTPVAAPDALTIRHGPAPVMLGAAGMYAAPTR